MCECGQGPKIGGVDTGCMRCDAMERIRYAHRSNTDRVRDAIARFDSVLLVDLADAVGLNVERTRYAIRHLIDAGEVTVEYAGTDTQYRPVRARRAA